ncbi:uncharacterized protein RSE6_08410 [Rhynchosporium secalis]|uniref:Dehydrogenase/reductase n=1 Tax=Rhynchosporium secalis TaxID=38038 RepID=A0A1E1MGG8_RHYSE|nr:uncharacterized protein RSE6_08410 [Rhynchosporium secalis]
MTSPMPKAQSSFDLCGPRHARAAALKKTLESAPSGHRYIILPVDLTSQSSIRSFAADINSRIASGSIAPISALILNAGVIDTDKEYFTDDGFERTFVVNYLSCFLLTLLLLGSMDQDHGRVINVGSTTSDVRWWVHQNSYSRKEQRDEIVKASPEMMAKGLETFPDGDVMKTGQRWYARSKILLNAWMYELQRRLNSDPSLRNISVLGHDPGWIGTTDLNRNANVPIRTLLAVLSLVARFTWIFSPNPILRTAEMNGGFLLTLCFDREKFGEHPKALYVDGGVLYKTVPEAEGREFQGNLWKKSLEFVNSKGRRLY